MLSLLLFTFVCGSGAQAEARSAQLDAWVRAKHRHAAFSTENTTRVANGFVFVRADEQTMPFDDPVDLEGSTFRFTRRDANAFSVAKEPLAYDENVGEEFVSFGRATSVKTLPLKFAFPFGAGSYEEVTLAILRGIHFTRTPEISSNKVELLDALMATQPLLAPLLDSTNSPGGYATVFVKESANAVTITWRSQYPGTVDYDYQAVLDASGTIRFSYRRMQNMGWGGVVVRTGGNAWLAQKSAVTSLQDPAGDVDPLYADERGMLDIEKLSIARVANSSLLEVRMQLAAPVDRAKLRDGASYLVYLGDSVNRVELTVYKDKLTYLTPGGSRRDESSAAWIEGRDVVMFVTEEMLALESNSMRVWAYSNAYSAADSLTGIVNLGDAVPAAETDFSALTALEASRPLIETYSLGTLNVYGVWQRVREDLDLRDDEVDAVMVFPAFLNDIIYSRHGAFALFGNHGANGASSHASKSSPRFPTLIHMNSLFAFGGEQQLQVMLHELGHRWLYNFEIQGESSRVLNPVSPHPAHYVSTAAAFPWRGEHESSAMGGAVFTDNRDGTFTTAPEPSWFGFSWHELYLMGLAAPEEVQPWFYLRDSGLGDEYHPPANKTVSATRVDVSLQQIIDVMGPRDPAFAASQKEFRVLLVIVERDGTTPTPRSLRGDFERVFAAATGNRGRVRTHIGSGKQRAVRK